MKPKKENIYPPLKDLEEKRIKLKNKIYAVAIGYTTTFFVVCSSICKKSPAFYIGSSVVYILIAVILYSYLVKGYKQDFKEDVIHPLVKEIDQNLSYYPNLHILEEQFNNSDIFDKPDRIDGNDYVKGELDGVKIEFSDFYAQKKLTGRKSENRWSTIFQGLFIVCEFDKEFTKELIINSKDSKKFQDIFNLKDQIDNTVYISIKHNKVYIAIEYNKDLFEPSIFHSLLNYKIADEYVKTLHLVLNIVEELKQNKKLWS